jgi:hypothetical protein
MARGCGHGAFGTIPTSHNQRTPARDGDRQQSLGSSFGDRIESNGDFGVGIPITGNKGGIAVHRGTYPFKSPGIHPNERPCEGVGRHPEDRSTASVDAHRLVDEGADVPHHVQLRSLERVVRIEIRVDVPSLGDASPQHRRMLSGAVVKHPRRVSRSSRGPVSIGVPRHRSIGRTAQGRFVESTVGQDPAHDFHMHRRPIVGCASHGEMLGRELGTQLDGNGRLKRLGARAHVEGAIDVTECPDRPPIRIDGDDTAVMKRLVEAGPLDDDKHAGQEETDSAVPDR